MSDFNCIVSIIKNLTISLTVIYPVANTIAFGGVATGSMNAKDVAMAHGNIKYKGFSCKRTACTDKEESNTYLHYVIYNVLADYCVVYIYN